MFGSISKREHLKSNLIFKRILHFIHITIKLKNSDSHKKVDGTVKELLKLRVKSRNKWIGMLSKN